MTGQTRRGLVKDADEGRRSAYHDLEQEACNGHGDANATVEKDIGYREPSTPSSSLIASNVHVFNVEMVRVQSA